MKKNYFLSNFLLTLSLFFLCAVYSHAQKTWDGGAGTRNWHDGNNWAPNGEPTSTDDVSLVAGDTVNITMGGEVARKLEIKGTPQGGNLNILSGSLSIGQNGVDLKGAGLLFIEAGASLSVTDVATVDGIKVYGSATFINNGQINIDDPSAGNTPNHAIHTDGPSFFENNGNISITGVHSAKDIVFVESGSRFDNNGKMTIGSSNLNTGTPNDDAIQVEGTFNNGNCGILDITNPNKRFNVNGSGVFNNHGVITLESSTNNRLAPSSDLTNHPGGIISTPDGTISFANTPW